MHEPDPLKRVALINKGTTVRKQAHDAEALYAFFHAVSMSALSCSGTRHFGLCTDSGALEGLAEVERGLDAAMDELRERC